MEELAEKRSLRIDVQEAHVIATRPPLYSTSSTATLVDFEPFGDEHVFTKKHFVSRDRELSWSPPPRSWPPPRRRRCLGAVAFCLAAALYFLYPTFRISPQPKRPPKTCNPFEARGLLQINASSPDQTFWRPFSASCRPSLLSNELRKERPSIGLGFLQDRTVVMIGDSVDRRHAEDFCALARGRGEYISSLHDASPAPFHNYRDELLKVSGEHSEKMARPFVCTVDQHNLVLMSIHHFGMSTIEEYGPDWFRESKIFYPPFHLVDRIDHIIAPLLRAYRRRKPDLVTFASSFLDAAQYGKKQSRSDQTALPEELATRFAERLGDAFVDLLETDLFADANILWRTAHPPKASSGLSAHVVLALDEVAQTVVHELKTASSEGWWTSKATSFTKSDLTQAAQRLRVDYSGRMLQGQASHLHDELHPSFLPNGKIWADILLYELREAVASP